MYLMAGILVYHPDNRSGVHILHLGGLGHTPPGKFLFLTSKGYMIQSGSKFTLWYNLMTKKKPFYVRINSIKIVQKNRITEFCVI